MCNSRNPNPQAVATLVVVVSDDPDATRSVGEQLSSEHRVVAALDAREGLRMAAELRPDLIVTDARMRVDGGTFVQAIRSHGALASTPILLLSIADDALRVQGLREGAQDFVRVPWAEEELRARVEKLIAVKRAREIEGQWTSFVNQAPDGIFVADVDGRFSDVNDAGCKLLGYSRDEIIGKNVVDLIPPNDIQRLTEHRERLLQGVPEVGEWTLRCKDGTDLPVEVSARILPDGRWQGLVRDISTRKALARQAALDAQRLRESEERFRLALDEAPIGMALVALDGRFVRTNRALSDLVGYSPDELTGMTFQQITHPDDLSGDLELAEQLYRGEIPRYQLPKRYIRKDGQIVDVMLSGSVLRAPTGEALYYIAQIEDITERKRQEKEQRFLAEVGPVLASTLDYEETLTTIARLVVEHLADFCIVDIVGGDEVRRLKVSCRDPAKDWVCEALMNISLDRERPHLVWSSLKTRKPVLSSPLTSHMLASFAQSDDHFRALRGLDASSMITVPLCAHNRLLGVIALISSSHSRAYDQEDLRLAEEVARRAALSIENAHLYLTARRAIQDRDEVLGIVAHDLRNPLNSVVGHADLLQRTSSETHDGTQKSIRAIRRSARRMNRLIQDLLDVMQMEGGALRIDSRRISTSEILSEVLETQSSQASAASLDVRLDVVDGIPDVWGDRDRLLQVFENLIGNAQKFTPSGGRITVGSRLQDGEVLFWVSDTGSGIGAQDIPHLFDRFWQARKTERRGAGLGLPIVKHIVEAHDGRIWVESTLGVGSTFFFTLPRAARVEQHSAGALSNYAVPRFHPRA